MDVLMLDVIVERHSQGSTLSSFESDLKSKWYENIDLSTQIYRVHCLSFIPI